MKISQDRIHSLMNSPAKLAVLRQLMMGGVLTERRIAQYANLSHVSVSRVLEEFERFHLASSRRVGKANQWAVHRDSYAYRLLEPVLKTLEQMPSPLETLARQIKRIVSKKMVKKAVLYGSVAGGDEQDRSDIDLCLILRRGIKKTQAAVQEMEEILPAKCYQLFGKHLSLLVVTQQGWERMQSKEIGKAISKGKIIIG